MRNFTNSSVWTDLLDNKTYLTDQDRFAIDAYVVPTLEEHCGDIRTNELEKVKQIEEKNIIQFFKVAAQVLGLGDNSLIIQLSRMYPMTVFIDEINKKCTGKEREKTLIMVFVKYLLSEGNVNLNVKVQGEMPQKLFSFRQMTADEWFKKYVNVHLASIVRIYEKMGLRDAQTHLAASTAYQLYQVRPGRYNINNMSDNDALHHILTTYLDSNGEGRYERFSPNNNEILFKDI